MVIKTMAHHHIVATIFMAMVQQYFCETWEGSIIIVWQQFYISAMLMMIIVSFRCVSVIVAMVHQYFVVTVFHFSNANDYYCVHPVREGYSGNGSS
jgi:hypothetical protein